jgi:fructoselysine-6-P-deglycase FrlB-like protein
MTNEADSPLAQLADVLLPLSMGLERSMAATKTFSAQLLALGMLAASLSGREDLTFDEVPSLFRAALERTDSVIGNWDHYTASSSCFVLARGALLPVARELCCKLQETCLINATPYSAADFLHGPFSLIEPGVQVILFHRADETATCTVTERVPEIKGSVLSSRKGEVDEEIPGWQGGKYTVTLARSNGQWKVTGMKQIGIIVEQEATVVTED